MIERARPRGATATVPVQTAQTASVRRLDYTGHRHANEGAAAAGFVAGGLIGMFAGSPVRSTDHYLELEYMLPDGSVGRPLVPPPQGESAGNHRRHARGHRDREVTHINFHTPSCGDVHGGAIVSNGWPDEADAVAVRVTDDEVAAPPRLLLELLVERRAGRHVFSVERFHVLDLDEGGDESIPVLRADGEHGLVHEFEMYTGTVARHGAIERRVAV